MFVIVSLFASVAYESLIQSLIALTSPWYVWLVVVIGFAGILSTEIKGVLAGGILFTTMASYIALTVSDWPGIIVIVAAWALFLGSEYLKSR